MELIRQSLANRAPTCDECGTTVDVVVTIGETPDYESATANICRDCLFKAFYLIDLGGK